MIRVALVDLPEMLGGLLEQVLAARPEVHVVTRASMEGLTPIVAGRRADVVFGRWGTETMGATVARALLRENPTLVVVAAVPGPPEWFHLHTRAGVRALPCDVSPAVLVDEIRRLAGGGAPAR